MTVTKRLLALLAPFRWWILLAILLSFATVGSSVGLMAMSSYLISKAAVTSNQSELALATTGVRFFALSRAVLRYLERLISHMTTFRILTHLRTWFYQAIEPLSPARLQTRHSGDLLARIMSDIETLEDLYSRVIIPPFAAALVTLFASAILGSFNILLGISLLLFMLLTGLLLPLATRALSRRPAAEIITLRSHLSQTAVDTIQGLPDLTAFGQQQRFQDQILNTSRQIEGNQQQLAFYRGLSNGLTALFTSLSALTILFIAIPLVTSQQINGLFLALMPLTAIAAFEALQPLSQSLQLWESSQAAGSRLFEMIDAQPEVLDPQNPAPAPKTFDIELQDINFAYNEKEPMVLHNFNLKLEQGRRLALLGRSGSGKSSIVNLLLRFWEFEGGKLRIGGHDIRKFDAHDVRRWITIVPQQTHLFNSTIRDNLYLADPDASDEVLAAACRKAQIDDFIQSLPLGYDTWIGENGVLLSGGERQRLAIARAILKDAPIFILDEATANLDATTEKNVWAALEHFMDGRATLIISHKEAQLPAVDQTIIME